MAERVCAECGAINRLSADACWRCLESLGDPSTPIAAATEPPPEPRPATR